MKHGLRMILAVALLLCVAGAAWAFTDTDGLDDTQLAAIDYLSDLGVINGYTDGTFRPYYTVTRAEFAKMICVYAGYGELSGGSRFSDVADGEWYTGWINRAANQNLVQGNTDGSFLPSNTISHQELATILLRLDGIDETDMTWPADYIAAARERGLDAGFNFNGTQAASRIVACQMIYNLAGAENGGSGTETVYGVILDYEKEVLTILADDGNERELSMKENLLPSEAAHGSFVELEVFFDIVLSVPQHIYPRYGYTVWEINDDGKTVNIGGTDYDYTDAVLFNVTFRNRSISSDNFRGASLLNPAMIATGERLEAELALLIDDADGQIGVAYLIDAGVLRRDLVDVVDGLVNSADGIELTFLNNEASYPLDSSLSRGELQNGCLVRYTLRNNVIDNYDILLDPTGREPYVVRDISYYLTGEDRDAPYAWVDSWDGSEVWRVGSVNEISCHILSSSSSAVRLGYDSSNSRQYNLAADCRVYEYHESSDTVTEGTTRNLSRADRAIALVTPMQEISHIYAIFFDE